MYTMTKLFWAPYQGLHALKFGGSSRQMLAIAVIFFCLFVSLPSQLFSIDSQY